MWPGAWGPGAGRLTLALALAAAAAGLGTAAQGPRGLAGPGRSRRRPLSTADPGKVFRSAHRVGELVPGPSLKGHHGAIPTNAWWENAVLPAAADSQESAVFQMPYVTMAAMGSLRIMQPFLMGPAGESFSKDLGVSLGAVQPMLPGHRVEAWDELSVTLAWRGAGGRAMVAPLVRGSPYITVEYTNASPKLISTQVLTPNPAAQWPSIRVDGVSAVCDGTKRHRGAAFAFDLQQSDSMWMLFTPKSVRWICHPNPFAMIAEGPLTGAVRLALANSCRTGALPTQCQGSPRGRNARPFAALLLRHAGAYPVGVSLDYQVDRDVGTVHWKWNSKCLHGFHCGSLLQLAWPVHWPLLEPKVRSAPEASIRTPFHDIRGVPKPVVGDSWQLSYDLFPDVGLRPPRAVPDSARAELLDALRGSGANSSKPDHEFDLPHGYRQAVGDTYFSGKMLGRLARLVQIADELGESGEDYFKDMVERLAKRMEVWLKKDAQTPFVYDATWGGLLSCGCIYDDCGGYCAAYCSNEVDPPELCPALQDGGGNMNFGNSLYNDHHFHYGYFVYGAAVLAKYKPSWEKTWREQILAIVRDYGNPSWEDKSFPVARHKDWFLGFSWAGGLQAFANGRNQESTSEAINSYYALYAYGASADAPFAQELRDFGRLLMAMETHGADVYWHVRKNSEIYGQDFHHRVVGIMWEHTAEYQTWFGTAPYVVSGIQLLPFIPAMENVLAKDWVAEHFSRYKATCDQDPECAKGWSWPLCLEQAVLDPDEAYKCIQSLPEDAFSAKNAAANGNSLTNSLHWIATRPDASKVSWSTSFKPNKTAEAHPEHAPADHKAEERVENAEERVENETSKEEESEVEQNWTAAEELTTLHGSEAPTWCFQRETRYSPLDMPGQRRSVEKGVIACQLRCVTVHECRHFTYFPDGSCHLQDAEAHASKELIALAGPRTCQTQAPLSTRAAGEIFPPVHRVGSAAPSLAFKDKHHPLPTNAWWEPLAFASAPGMRAGGVHQMPYVVLADTGAIQVAHPTATTSDVVAEEEDLDISLGAAEGMSGPFADAWDELSVTLGWRIADRTVMSVPIVRGSPYITAEYIGSTPRFSSRQTLYSAELVWPKIEVDHRRVSCDGITPLHARVFSFTFADDHSSWSLFAPKGTEWICVPAPFSLTARSSLYGAVRVALTSNGTKGHDAGNGSESGEYAKLLEQHAGSFPVSAVTEYVVNGDIGTMRWIWSSRNLKGWSPTPLLQLAWPVHVPLLPSAAQKAATASPVTPFHDLHGPALAVTGNAWDLRYELFPDVGLRSPRAVPSNLRPELLEVLRGPGSARWNASSPDCHFDLPEKYQLGVGDTYYSGKMLARLARLVAIAGELGEQGKAYFAAMLDRLRRRMEAWLRKDAATPFIYDASWGGLVSCGCLDYDCQGTCTPRCTNPVSPAEGCPALAEPGVDLFNSVYNNHHFHYGYFVYGAAVVAKYDPGWETRWRDEILSMVRDYGNPSAGDPSFPVVRHKDWFLGFSWAGGIKGDTSGRSQAMTSEAINSYYALYAYGASAVDAPFAQELRDFGRLLAAMESHGAATYWQTHERPPSRLYGGSKAAGPAGRDAAPYEGDGLQLLPFTPVTESYITKDWATKHFHDYQRTCKDPACVRSGWKWPMCLEQAVLDPEQARSCLLKLPQDAFSIHNKASNGNSLTNSLHWILTRPDAKHMSWSPPRPSPAPAPAKKGPHGPGRTTHGSTTSHRPKRQITTTTSKPRTTTTVSTWIRPKPTAPFNTHVACPHSPGAFCRGNQCCPDGSACPSSKVYFLNCPGLKGAVVEAEVEDSDLPVSGRSWRGLQALAAGAAVLLTAAAVLALAARRASASLRRSPAGRSRRLGYLAVDERTQDRGAEMGLDCGTPLCAEEI